MKPIQKYPIYVPSKGRYESRLTIKELERMNVPYKVVIEHQEYDNYAAVIDPSNILVLPFSNLGLVASRNWIWEHSIQAGHVRHWQIDDNIVKFLALNHNVKTRVHSAEPFIFVERIVDEYTNVGLAGLQYNMFSPRKKKHPPFIMNTRIFSCTLIHNALPMRYRAFFNDDTDLSLRVLKLGLCTMLFMTYICSKKRTMTVKGGLTGHYAGDGRLRMAHSLYEQHPDCTKIVKRYGRWQHLVDYRPFKNNQLRAKTIAAKQYKLEEEAKAEIEGSRSCLVV